MSNKNKLLMIEKCFTQFVDAASDMKNTMSGTEKIVAAILLKALFSNALALKKMIKDIG